MGYRHVEVRRLAGALGAEIGGVDLSRPLAEPVFEEVRRAFLEHAVIFFRDQELTPERQLAFARRFGEPEVHPIVEGTEEHPDVIRVVKPAGASASFGVGWHCDNTFFPEPSLGTLLFGRLIPPYGGDTLFSHMGLAYEALSEPIRRLLDGLVAVHSASRAYDPRVTGREKYSGEGPLRYRWSEAIESEVEHPAVRTHPETGRRVLYVNPMFTIRFPALHPAESRALLELLFEHGARPEFTCRFRWEPGSVALWDNRCVWHYAMDDYREFERIMFRVTIAGDRPR
jgi:taurine dioxygenase